MIIAIPRRECFFRGNPGQQRQRRWIRFGGDVAKITDVKQIAAVVSGVSHHLSLVYLAFRQAIINEDCVVLH